MTFIIAAPLAGTRDAWLQAGEPNGRQRAEKTNTGAGGPMSTPFCSFDRYNNLVCSRHV
jgi:hypothetical protein